MWLSSHFRTLHCVVIAHESYTMVGLLRGILIHSKVVCFIIRISWILEEVWVTYEGVERITIRAIYDAVLSADLWWVETLQSWHCVVYAHEVSTTSIFAYVLYQEVIALFLLFIGLLLAHLLDKAEFTSFIHSDRVFARAVHHLYLAWSFSLCWLLVWIQATNSWTLLNI